jgi:uncharacterized membrane protein YdjX (TVP38/TMEM64 family)
MSDQSKFIVRISAGILSFIALYLVVLMILSKYGISVSDIKTFVEGLGTLGYLALVLLMAFSVMSPFPDTPTALVANVLYGPIIGFFIVLVGSLLGALLDFIIVRKLGRKFFIKRYPSFVQSINKVAQRFGFESMVFFRIFPTVTFDIVSYTAALTKVKFSRFAVATLLGLLPLAITYSIVGRGLETQDGYAIMLSIILGLGLISSVILFSKYFGEKLNLNALEDETIV